jgi:hypothetical protein
MIYLLLPNQPPMPDLRDPIWQFIGAIIGLVALILTALIFYWQRKKKALDYETNGGIKLTNIEGEVKDRISILFDGIVVKDVSLFVLKLRNSGSLPILADDFARPIRMIFGSEAEVLTAELLESDPENINPTINVESKNTVSLSPVLLNPGDYIRVKMLLNQFDGDFTLDGRITDVKQIKLRTEGNRTISPLDRLIFIFLIIDVGAMIAYNAYLNGIRSVSLIIQIVIGASVLYFLLFLKRRS